MDILPWVIDYWKRLPVTKAIVYDNESTDGSKEYLQQFDWIEVRTFQTDGMNDSIQRDIKENSWKESKGLADYVIVCDLDEVIYSKNISSTLQKMKDGNYNVLGLPWYMLCATERPQYTEGKLLHEVAPEHWCTQYINHDHPHSHLGKFMLFDPNKVDSMNPSVGWHICYPTPSLRLLEVDCGQCISLHINKGLGENYFVDKRKNMNARLSDHNRKNGYCYEYAWDEQKQRKWYRENVAKSFNIYDKIGYPPKSLKDLYLEKIISLL